MIDDIFEKVALHKKRLTQALKEIDKWESMDSRIFEDFEKVKVVDTFIYRFIKYQDIIGDKLFKLFLDEIGEYKDSMSLIDVLDKLEKFNIIQDSRSWFEYRKLRNQLTHEYPNNEDEIIEGIVLAKNAFYDIENILQNILNYLNKKNR